MAPSGPMAPILAGTPCRPHDQPHAHRAGRVKAAAERSDVAQSASLEAARTMSNLAPRKRQLLIRSLPRRGRGSRAGRSGRAAWAAFRLMTSSNLSGCSTGPVARPRFPQNVACGDRREEPKVCRLSAGGSGIRTFSTFRKEPLSLSLFGGFGPEVSRLCLCDSLLAPSVRSQFRHDRRWYTEGTPLR